MIYQSFAVLSCLGVFAEYWQGRYGMLDFVSKLNGI
jgi:hypothetical protein